jgi:undecaprenyl-diphosphatase
MGEGRALALRHAVALGLLHGPTELLPISSSGHTTLVPWFARWPYAELDPQLRKSFEVALHAGTAAALLLRPPGPCLGERVSFLAPAVLAPTLCGYALGEQIERRLGTPATIAAGLLVGSSAMISAEFRASGTRPRAAAGFGDGLALGLAQALALMPGISRSGATIAAARARGFSRRDADRLSWSAGLPVIAGATLLKIAQLARGGLPRGLRLPLAGGAASAFASTLVSTRAITPRSRTALLPVCIVYRAALALLAIRRMRDNTTRTPQPPKK